MLRNNIALCYDRAHYYRESVRRYLLHKFLESSRVAVLRENAADMRGVTHIMDSTRANDSAHFIMPKF